VALALLCAERYRRQRRVGQCLRIALSDVALAVVADLGFLAEVEINREARARYGNQIFGAFGCDFATSDGRRLMTAAVTPGQWKALCRATGIEESVQRWEQARGLDLRRDADRFTSRNEIADWLRQWFASRTLIEAGQALDREQACWGPYQSFEQLVKEDPRCSPRNSLFAHIEHPGIGRTLTARSPLDFSGVTECPPQAAPVLGADTDEVLQGVLGFTVSQMSALRRRGVIAGSYG
jgi:2-methylfumaryl-CoA isomerase